MGNIIIRVDDNRKAAYEARSKSKGRTLSDWMRGLADADAGYGVAKAVPGKKGPVADAPMRPFDPSGPEVVTEPIKGARGKRSKKAGKEEPVLERVATPTAAKAAAPAAPVNEKRTYTGAAGIFNGIMMYEYTVEGSSRSRWTKDEPPTGK